jgi:hypothetical protein
MRERADRRRKVAEKYILGRIMGVIPRCAIEIGYKAVGKATSRRNRALLNPRYSIHPSANAMSTKIISLSAGSTYWDVFCRMPCQCNAVPSSGPVI